MKRVEPFRQRLPVPRCVFSGDEGADVGLDAETNVSPDYKQNANRFTGTIVKVTVEQR